MEKPKGKTAKEQRQFMPKPDLFVSEILCDRCKYGSECDPSEDGHMPCAAYRALEREMPQ